MAIRILIIMTNSMGITGVSTSVMNYYDYMDKSNLKINFVVPNKVDHKLISHIKSNGSKVHELRMREQNPLQYMRKLIRIIKAGHYDIVHAHGNSCTLFVEMLAAKIGGVKIRIAHSNNTTCTHLTLHKLLRPFFDCSYTQGFACGTDAGKWLFGKKPFIVMNNGNDIEKFSYNEQIRQELRNQYKLEGKKVIGHVGSFNYQKNHSFLIDIFDELTKINPDYNLFLIGDGELRSEIEHKVEQLGLSNKVIFTGRTLEVNKMLQAMDIMVLPSRFEGLPNVVVEWQIACLPSIVSDHVTKDAKLTELVEFMSLEKGAKAWAERINEMEISDRSEISDAVHEEIQKAGYDIRDNAKELKNLYINFIHDEEYK